VTNLGPGGDHGVEVGVALAELLAALALAHHVPEPAAALDGARVLLWLLLRALHLLLAGARTHPIQHAHHPPVDVNAAAPSTSGSGAAVLLERALARGCRKRL
jgi:hypothetical protein